MVVHNPSIMPYFLGRGGTRRVGFFYVPFLTLLLAAFLGNFFPQTKIRCIFWDNLLKGVASNHLEASNQFENKQYIPLKI